VTCHEAIGALDAYIDDELTEQEAMPVRTHVRSCVYCFQRAQDREALRRTLRSLPYYGAPTRLGVAIAAHIGARSSIPKARGWTIAATLLIAGSAGIGVRTWTRMHVRSVIAEQVMARHVNALATQHLVDVRSSDQHTGKPWFQGKLDFAPPVFDLADGGFPLLGGRVDTIDGRPFAALVYERRLHIITTFVSNAEDPIPEDLVETIRGFHERHWTDHGMCFWIVSDLNEDELAEFASMIRSKAK
jgi:anti-sigma factor RsiW